MTPLECYLDFVTAYEKARRTDDWAFLARLVDEDVTFIYPIENYGGGIYQGRAAFLFHSKARECLFSRRFDQCELGSLNAPVVLDDTVSHHAFGAWRLAGLPDLVIEFELRVTFDEGLALRVEEVWEPTMKARLRAYVRAHGETLGASIAALDLAPTAELALLQHGMKLVDRRISSMNTLASVSDRTELRQSATRVECRSTWCAPDMPDLSLQYELTYAFSEGDTAQVQTRWDTAMRKRWDTYVDAHGEAIRVLASDSLGV